MSYQLKLPRRIRSEYLSWRTRNYHIKTAEFNWNTLMIFLLLHTLDLGWYVRRCYTVSGCYGMSFRYDKAWTSYSSRCARGINHDNHKGHLTDWSFCSTLYSRPHPTLTPATYTVNNSISKKVTLIRTVDFYYAWYEYIWFLRLMWVIRAEDDAMKKVATITGITTPERIIVADFWSIA